MKAFLLILLSGSLAQAALDPLPVEALDNGACWVSQVEPEVWRVASFNDQAAFHLDLTRLKYEFEPALTAKLKSLGLGAMDVTNYQTSIHCSGAGHILIMNFHEASVPLCVFTNHTLSEMTVYSNPLRQQGVCGGAALEILVIKALDAIHAQHLHDLLTGPQYAHLVKSAELMPAIGALAVTLQASWRFKETLASEQIKADAELSKHIEDISPSHVWTVVGQSKTLLKREFKGYTAVCKEPEATTEAPICE